MSKKKRYTHAPLYTLQHYDTQGMETTKVSINIWMYKQIQVHLDNEILFSAKNKWDTKLWKNVGGNLNAYY